jgi:hypothetical protein
MAIQMSIVTRNARLDAIESTAGASCSMRIYTGAQPANCAAINSGTILADFNLPADWMNAAGAGAKTLLGAWQEASAENPGEAAHFRLYNSQAVKDETTCFLQGDVQQGAGDLSLDNITITATQVIDINTFTLTDGNA